MKQSLLLLLLGSGALCGVLSCAPTTFAQNSAVNQSVASNEAASKLFAESRPVYRAEEFVESIGLNAAPFERPGHGNSLDPKLYLDLGVRYNRCVLFNDNTSPETPQLIAKAWREHGVRAMPFIDATKTKTAEDVMQKLREYDPRSVAELEGPNELNNKFGQDLNLKFGGKTDEAAGALLMDGVYKAVKADPVWKSLPIVAYTAIFSDYSLAKPHNGFDYGNMHSYQGYNVPSSSLLMNITRFNNIYPAGATIKPVVPTECGYNVEADETNHTFKVGSRRAQALNIPMLLAEYFNHGIKRTYLFALHNADGYGLLEGKDNTKRPSYFALKNFIAQLQDARWNTKTLKWDGGRNFTPRALMFSMPGAPDTIHSLTLQKQSGEYSLLLWNEVKNFDEGAKKDIFNAPVPVTLKLQTPVNAQATILTQNDKGEYDTSTATVQGGELRVNVPSSVMIVRLTPRAVADKTAPAAPKFVSSSATENSVAFRWNHSASRDVAGYFVFRNGQFLTSTRSTSFEDKTAWVRPGLGYNYDLQAYDRAGNLSPRVRRVVVTPAKIPDLVISKFEMPSAKAGDDVRFRITIKNAGDGATPHDTLLGASFSVGGRGAGWGTMGGEPLQAGEERVLESSGGAPWKATAGTHVVQVHLDDINRIGGERNEFNNTADRTWRVDASNTGLLLGSSDAAPGAVNLTQEGALDWIAWGLNGKDSVVRKAGGKGNFGALGKVGDGYRDATSGSAVRLRWSDGDNPKTHDGTNAGMWLNGVGHGYEFSAVADATERVLKVYVSAIEGARGKFVAKLSDGSAPEYVSTTWNSNAAFDWAPVPGAFSAVYTVRYRAASPNQKLTVQWILDGEPNRFLGQARLQAATLSLP